MKPHLGEFERLILLALVRLGENAYGMSIREELQSHTGREVSLGSVYKALWRLERKGIAWSRIGDPTPERGGRRKRLYRLSPAGRRILQDSLDALKSLSRGLGKQVAFP